MTKLVRTVCSSPSIACSSDPDNAACSSTAAAISRYAATPRPATTLHRCTTLILTFPNPLHRGPHQ